VNTLIWRNLLVIPIARGRARATDLLSLLNARKLKNAMNLHGGQKREKSTAKVVKHSQVAGKKRVGERGRNRTYNLLIKSQLLCQLSYAPVFARDTFDQVVPSRRINSQS
jgi:hypothetical protein